MARTVAEESEELGLRVVGDEEGIFRRSDNFAFACRDVPALWLHTGFHDDYHAASDEPALIDTDKAARVARLTFLLVHRVATTPALPTWTSAGRTEVRGCG